jgi:hypothetical protein
MLEILLAPHPIQSARFFRTTMESVGEPFQAEGKSTNIVAFAK